MDTNPIPERPSAAGRTAPSLLVPFLAGLLLFVGFAPAQSLPELLPEDVVAAIGVRDLTAQQDRIQPFLDEAERLGLVESVSGAVPDDADPEELADTELPDVPEALRDLDPLDVLGQEAWVAVSASPFRPIPAVTVIVRPNDEAAQAFRTVIQDAEGQEGVERLSEGDRTLYTFVPPSETSDFDLPIAYALADEGVLVASSDPEIVRFVLRGLSGSDEASFAQSDAFAALEGLGEGVTFGLLDAAPLANALEPFATSFEAGPVLQRVHDALLTAGPAVGLTRVTDEGLESRGLLMPREDGPDQALYGLLTEGTTADASVLRFVPDDAVTLSASVFDVSGWWAWLDDVLASAQSLGLPPASQLMGMFGIDPQAALLDWAGDDLVQIVAAPPVAAEAGIPQEGFGQGSVVLLEATDEAAARQGLNMLLSAIGPNMAAFTSPSGQAVATPETVQVAGRDVQRLQVSDTMSIDAAVVDGWALLSMSPDATEAILNAYAADDGAPEAFADVAADLPLPARAWSVSDVSGMILGSSEALVAQLQLLAGLGGAGDLDFDAVDEASADVQAWLTFLGERVGTSRSVTTVEDGTVRTEGLTPVDW